MELPSRSPGLRVLVPSSAVPSNGIGGGVVLVVDRILIESLIKFQHHRERRGAHEWQRECPRHIGGTRSQGPIPVSDKAVVGAVAERRISIWAVIVLLPTDGRVVIEKRKAYLLRSLSWAWR